MSGKPYWIGFIASGVVCLTMLPGCSAAPLTRAERQAIRNTPLLERPDRFGHFYGNTVRRLYYGHPNHNGRR